MNIRKTIVLGIAWSIAILALPGFTGIAPAATETLTLKKLERLILQQQAQIEAQAKTIETMRKKVAELSKAPPTTVPAAPPEEKSMAWVKSGSKKVSAKLYGQVNRAVLVTDDGDTSNWYSVDNDNSSTRVGILASAKASSDLEIGSKVEVEFQSNDSNKVSQEEENGAGDNNFRKRHLDLFFKSSRFGKFSLGHGATASDGTSQVDLSATAVAGYSDVAAMAGGHLFYDDDNESRTDIDGSGTSVTVANAFNDMDGLGRDDRIRYDSPNLFGFVASTSAISGDGGDVAVRYSAKTDGFKFAAAAAWSNPATRSGSVDDIFNGSLSILHNCGFSVTLAGGSRDHKADGRDDGTFYYGKLGYQRKFFSFGTTALALDYGRFDDITRDEDEASTFGAMAVQNFRDWGTEFYVAYRNYDLDRPGENLEAIDAVMSGFRLKF